MTSRAMVRSPIVERCVRILPPLFLLSLVSCGPTGSGPHFVNNDVRSIGTYRYANSRGQCVFAADVNVDTGADTVTIDGNIFCQRQGSLPDYCAFEVRARQTFHTYSITAPRGHCDLGPPGQSSVRQTFSCVSPSDCSGQWSADAGVTIWGYSGTQWRASNYSECQTMGGATANEVIQCEFTYAGTTI
jgi:hypothetical protein